LRLRGTSEGTSVSARVAGRRDFSPIRSRTSACPRGT
jgi:hypothetical protein